MRAALLLVSAALVTAPAAFAQTATNDQLDLRGSSSEMSVVTDSAIDVGATAASGGNAYAVFGEGTDVELDSVQHADGQTDATASVSAGSAGGAVVVTSAAVANGLTSSTVGSSMDVRATQVSHADANATTISDTGYVGDAAASSAASANVAALSAEQGDIRADLMQESTGSVNAVTEADHWAVGGQAVADAIASANNISASGTTTTLLTNTTQTATGDHVSAEVQFYAGSAGDAVGNATANANALNLDNAFGYVNAAATQHSTAAVNASAFVTLSEDFNGFASAGAYGVGNSAIAANVTSDTVLDISQNNEGAVSANAGLVADGGDQALASSAAYGNVATGSLCAYCGADEDSSLNAHNQQTNSGAVHASSTINAPNASMVAGTSSAIGNAATYQVAGPGG